MGSIQLDRWGSRQNVRVVEVKTIIVPVGQGAAANVWIAIKEHLQNGKMRIFAPIGANEDVRAEVAPTSMVEDHRGGGAALFSKSVEMLFGVLRVPVRLEKFGLAAPLGKGLVYIDLNLIGAPSDDVVGQAIVRKRTWPPASKKKCSPCWCSR